MSYIKRRDNGNSQAFFLRVRESSTMETKQFRSLKSDKDFVSFSIAFIVYVQPSNVILTIYLRKGVTGLHGVSRKFYA